jgi:hypothetical protein
MWHEPWLMFVGGAVIVPPTVMSVSDTMITGSAPLIVTVPSSVTDV